MVRSNHIFSLILRFFPCRRCSGKQLVASYYPLEIQYERQTPLVSTTVSVVNVKIALLLMPRLKEVPRVAESSFSRLVTPCPTWLAGKGQFKDRHVVSCRDSRWGNRRQSFVTALVSLQTCARCQFLTTMAPLIPLCDLACRDEQCRETLRAKQRISTRHCPVDAMATLES